MKNGYKIIIKPNTIKFKTYSKKEAKISLNCITKNENLVSGYKARGQKYFIKKITKYEIKKGIWKQLPF